MKHNIVMDLYPRTVDLIFTKRDLAKLKAFGNLTIWEGVRMPSNDLQKHLPQSEAIIGQPDLPEKLLTMAEKLKAIINVEGNFQPNVDYEYCFQKGISVLNAGVVFGQAVAEMALGFALSLARNIAQSDALFKGGAEVYGSPACKTSFLISGKSIGIIGFGNLGRALLRLLQPFRCRIRVFDPWLPARFLQEFGVQPCGLEELMKESRIVFMLAGATSENVALVGRRELHWLKKNAIFILASRASLVDFDALTEALQTGKFLAAVDVFPEEPLPEDHPIRHLDNVLLSAHRAGGLPETFKLMGEMIVDDLDLVFRNLPPVRLQKATRETVLRMRSKPVG
jgi:phosphoglycerate dehydrogenase-like enzyme